MSNSTGDYSLLVGRILMALIFLMSGFQKIFQFNGTAQKIAEQGLPLASIALAFAILFEVAGGLSVVFGFKTRLGSIFLILFLIPATLLFHDFWTFSGDEVRAQMVHFMKNLSILGGLLVLATQGPGALSVDSE
jgi:putative oxidoreductase